ncbi:hypothetical protein B0H34DRAFT_727514, partial [Crassisporium funariophilum]
MPGPPSTRPSNKTKHTALVAKKKTQSRRPTEEEQEKARKLAKQTAGKLEAARLEHAAQLKAQDLKANTH